MSKDMDRTDKNRDMMINHLETEVEISQSESFLSRFYQSHSTKYNFRWKETTPLQPSLVQLRLLKVELELGGRGH
jgi:hypothetical protein